jgi:hypothetical protein
MRLNNFFFSSLKKKSEKRMKRQLHVSKQLVQYESSTTDPMHPFSLSIQCIPEQKFLDPMMLPDILSKIGNSSNLCKDIYNQVKRLLMTPDLTVTLTLKIDDSTTQKIVTECKTTRKKGGNGNTKKMVSSKRQKRDEEDGEGDSREEPQGDKRDDDDDDEDTAK